MKCLFKKKKKKTLWKHQNADELIKELPGPNLSETKELRKIRESYNRYFCPEYILYFSLNRLQT